jgi:hypothetical protein
MTSFIWMIHRDKENSLGLHGVAPSYLVPKDLFRHDLSELQGSTLWVVLGGNAYRLALVIRVSAVDRILDGYHKGDILVTTNMCESIKIGEKYVSLSSFNIDFLEVPREGLSKPSESDLFSLRNTLKRNVSIRLAPPSTRSLSDIEIDLLPQRLITLVGTLYQAITSSVNLQDIWGDGKDREYQLKPYASFVRLYVKNRLPQIDFTDLEEEVLKRDPFFNLLHFSPSNSNTAHSFETSIVPRFDDLFRLINPEQIYARAFSSSELSELDLHESIKKTEAAEKKHQEILKDVSAYLMMQNLKVFQSTSVDLAYCLSGVLYVLEIKTAHSKNAVSQAAKGIFQLGSYVNGLSNSFKGVAPILLIQKTDNDSLNAFISSTAATLGIKVLLYDEGLDWPDKAKDLPLPNVK